MFLAYNSIRDIIICSICGNQLNDPRFVPCGRTFCNECIVGKSSDTEFECPCEENSHVVPVKGFPKALAIQNLLNREPEIMSRGEKAEKLRIELDKILNRINGFEKDLNHCEDSIRERCCSIINEIDLSTETAIQNIQNQRDELIEQVNSYEKACLENLKNDNDTVRRELDKSIKEIKEFHEKWQINFEKSKIDDHEIFAALKECAKIQTKMIFNKHAMMRMLYNDELLEFKPAKKMDHLLGSFDSFNLNEYSKSSYIFLLSQIDIPKINLLDFEKVGDKIVLFYSSECKYTVEVLIYNILTDKVLFENSIDVTHEIDTQHTHCYFIEDKNIFLSVRCLNNHTVLYTIDFDNLQVTKSYNDGLNFNIFDMHSNSKFVFGLLKGNQGTETAKVNLICVLDQSLVWKNLIAPRTFHIEYEIDALRVNESSMFILDEMLNVTMIDIAKEERIRDFKIDGSIFSIYNESHLISYNSSSNIVSYYDLDGSIVAKEAIGKDIKISRIKGRNNRVLLFDKANLVLNFFENINNFRLFI